MKTLSELLNEYEQDSFFSLDEWELWEIIRAILEADDPEPPFSYDGWVLESPLHAAWRNRQVLRDKLMEVLG